MVAGKENVAQDIVALVSGAGRLQPLLAKAERLRRTAKDAPQRREEIDGATLDSHQAGVAVVLASFGSVCRLRFESCILTDSWPPCARVNSM